MKTLKIALCAFLISTAAAFANGAGPDVAVTAGSGTTVHTLPGANAAGTTDTVALPIQGVTSGVPVLVTAPLSATITNPTSPLTLTSATTAYAIGNLIASSATAASVVVPSFAIATSGGAAVINKLLLTSNDSTSTAWGSAQIQVDLWTTAPTFTNGDRAAFVVATGTAAHRAAFTCTMSPEYGDGVYAECTPNYGSEAVKLASGTTIYWTLQALTISGVTGASKVFTLTAELQN